MKLLGSLRMVLLSAVLLQISALMPAPRVATRADSLARLGVPLLKSGDGDEKPEVPPPPRVTPEREAFERGEGNMFFQSPAPRTGSQDGMVDFFSKENFAEAGEIPLQGKVRANARATPGERTSAITLGQPHTPADGGYSLHVALQVVIGLGAALFFCLVGLLIIS
jgi:hypothetical protein